MCMNLITPSFTSIQQGIPNTSIVEKPCDFPRLGRLAKGHQVCNRVFTVIRKSWTENKRKEKVNKCNYISSLRSTSQCPSYHANARNILLLECRRFLHQPL